MSQLTYHVSVPEYVCDEQHPAIGQDLRTYMGAPTSRAPGEWPVYRGSARCEFGRLPYEAERGVLAALEAFEFETWPNG